MTTQAASRQRDQAPARAEQRPAQEQQPATPAKSASEILMDRVLAQTTANVQATARRCAEALDNPALEHLDKAMVMAEGVEALRKAITPDLMKRVLSLMNKEYGFLTDKDPSKPRWSGKKQAMETPTPYTEAEVKEVFIHSLLRGANLIGNEWNIISGKLYLTQNYYWRKITQVKGVTDFKPRPGVPVQHNGYTVVRFGASWKYNGLNDQLYGPDDKPGLPIPVIAQDPTKPDQVIGKAARKAYKRVYEQITATRCTVDGEVEDESEAPEPSPEEARRQIGAQELLTEVTAELAAADTTGAVKAVESKVMGKKELLGTAYGAALGLVNEAYGRISIPLGQRQPGEDAE